MIDYAPQDTTVPARGRSRPSYECPDILSPRATLCTRYPLHPLCPHYSRCSPPVGGGCSREVTSPPPSHWGSARAYTYRINSQQTAPRPAGRAVGARRCSPPSAPVPPCHSALEDLGARRQACARRSRHAWLGLEFGLGYEFGLGLGLRYGFGFGFGFGFGWALGLGLGLGLGLEIGLGQG